MKLIYFFFFLLAKQTLSYTVPDKKYCGNIFNNPITLDFDKNTNLVNVSASIFDNNYACNNEEYQYNNIDNYIEMPSDSNDCLNLILEKYNLCPCPPDILYNNNSNLIKIKNNQLSDIILEQC